jgi:hypothetical protein
MDKQTELQDGFVKAVRVLNKYQSFYDATIEALDEGEYTCTVITDESTTFYNVPFGVLTNSFSTIRLVPLVGSHCTLGFREGQQSRPELIKVDKISKLIFFDGTVGIPLTPNVVDRLNKIENWINDFVTTYNTHTHNVISVGSPTATPIPTENNTLTPTTNNDVANPNILQ